MDETEREELKEAYRKEKDLRVVEHMITPPYPPIPPNKSARSQQWETRNRPSGLNKACLAAKGSLIRTARTGHEIQADAQDSQD